MILRLHSNALRDLGQMTRNWMRESVKRHFPLRSHSKHLAHRFGQGRLQLHNLSIVDFSPPEVHFQASKNSLLYMSTDGGNSQVHYSIFYPFSLFCSARCPMVTSIRFSAFLNPFSGICRHCPGENCWIQCRCFHKGHP